MLKDLQGPEVSSRLRRAGTVRLGKAVEVLDNLGSSMTNLNPNSGFVSGVTVKSNELSILAFEVANTIVRGNSLMESISGKNVQQLKEVVLTSEGVQHLVSKDMDELLKLVAADKRLVLAKNCTNFLVDCIFGPSSSCFNCFFPRFKCLN